MNVDDKEMRYKYEKYIRVDEEKSFCKYYKYIYVWIKYKHLQWESRRENGTKIHIHLLYKPMKVMRNEIHLEMRFTMKVWKFHRW